MPHQEVHSTGPPGLEAFDDLSSGRPACPPVREEGLDIDAARIAAVSRGW
ncbi:hypothetical protein [Planotetraspora silvatica]|nr:hypothetical protein [Planotetraspora silvatica]